MYLIIYCVLGFLLHGTTAVTHSWKAFYTGSSGLDEFPEFVALNLIDDELMGYFDSRTNRFESKQSWMVQHLGKEYDEGQTNVLRGHVPTFKNNIAVAMERFNQSKGVHLYQLMYGCEWDDETKEVNGFFQFGYDGEDFVAFDLNTQTWTAPRQQSVLTKQKWDKDKAWVAQTKNYLSQICVDWLKKYVNYGQSSLLRTDLPSVSLLQKSPSSPVSCHATGFYPNRAVMFWRRDGEELQEDVEHGEIIPNHDGSFQMSVDLLKPPSDDWGKYECVFQLAGVKEDQVTRLNKDKIGTNYGDYTNMIIGIVIAVLLVLLAVGLAVIVGIKFCKCNETNCDTSSDNSSELTEKLNQAPKC